MYLSFLKLNPRSRRALTEASHPYELHRSLLTAFPDEVAGGPGRVLFRLDKDHCTGNMYILVQSEKEPNWRKLNLLSDLVEECKYKEINPLFSSGQVLRFRLRANPTKRMKETGKRQGIIEEEEQMEWLCKKGPQGGYELIKVIVEEEEFAKDRKKNKGSGMQNITLLSVRFEGLLRVINPQAFRDTLEDGIGSAKGLGFGLLSVALIKE